MAANPNTVFSGDSAEYTFVGGEPFVRVKDVTAIVGNAGSVLSALALATQDEGMAGQAVALLTLAEHMEEYRSYRLEVEAAKIVS